MQDVMQLGCSVWTLQLLQCANQLCHCYCCRCHTANQWCCADFLYVLQRGKVPIVAGGTGFYLRWFIHGRPSTPASNPEAAAQALELIGQVWVQAAAQVAAAQQEHQQQQADTDQLGLQPAQVAVTQQDHHHQQQQAGQQELQSAQEDPAAPQQQQEGQQSDSQEQQLRTRSTDPQLITLANDQAQGSSSPSSPRHASAAAAAAAAAADAIAKLPPVSPAAAAAARQLQEEQRWDVAVDVVQQLGDPETAVRIRAERNNWYRLQRVLQILIQNGGKPLSQLDVDTTKELDYDFRWGFGIQSFRGPAVWGVQV
jgi:tRNA A37 N6-isopentenylltransferase MiaA